MEALTCMMLTTKNRFDPCDVITGRATRVSSNSDFHILNERIGTIIVRKCKVSALFDQWAQYLVKYFRSISLEKMTR